MRRPAGASSAFEIAVFTASTALSVRTIIAGSPSRIWSYEMSSKMRAISAEPFIAGQLARKQTLIVGLRTFATPRFVALHTKRASSGPAQELARFLHPAFCTRFKIHAARRL
jgi:hypothetical protein